MVPRRQDLGEVRGAEMIGKIQISGPSAEECENAAATSELERLAYARGFEAAKVAAIECCNEAIRESNRDHSERTEEYVAEVNTADWIAQNIEQLKPEVNQ